MVTSPKTMHLRKTSDGRGSTRSGLKGNLQKRPNAEDTGHWTGGQGSFCPRNGKRVLPEREEDRAED